MERRLSSYTGCLLGLAAGDGLGQGPELVNGFLPTTAYTQMAAYGCNGLLLGLTQGQLSGTMAPPVRYIAMALSEWAALQLWREPKLQCWISRSDRMDYRRCPEPGMLDVLTSGEQGTMEEHVSTLNGPGALMAAAAVGLFFDPERLDRTEIQRLGAEAAALTHGDPAAFLSGAALAHLLSRIVWDGVTDLDMLVRETGAMIRKRFAREYHAAWNINARMRFVRYLARTRKPDALERLGSGTAFEVLMGSLFLCLTAEDVRTAVEAAAKWSPAGAAVVGAILGAVHGEEALPKEWLDELECGSVLRELAEDMFRGCPMMLGSKVFDVEWDAKYISPEL